MHRSTIHRCTFDQSDSRHNRTTCEVPSHSWSADGSTDQVQLKEASTAGDRSGRVSESDPLVGIPSKPHSHCCQNQDIMGYTPLQVIPPAAATPFDPAPYPTALSFDPYADLLLVGSSSGTVTSYCSAVSLERHAVYCAHGSKGFGTYSTMRMGFGAGEVRQLKVVDKEIWSLTEGGLAGAKRGGLVRWTVRYVVVDSVMYYCHPVAYIQPLAIHCSHYVLSTRIRSTLTKSSPVEREHA